MSKTMKFATHELLSKSIDSLFANRITTRSLTLNDVMRRAGERGRYLLMIALSLPFISPIPVPGLSNVVGIIISLLAIQTALNIRPHLPGFLGDRKFPQRGLKKIAGGAGKLLRALEKFAQPRHTHLFSLRQIKWANATALFLLGLLLALPIPPVVPFSNSFPSWGIILISLAVLENDGVMIWAGYAVAAMACLYLALAALGCVLGAERMLNI